MNDFVAAVFDAIKIKSDSGRMCLLFHSLSEVILSIGLAQALQLITAFRDLLKSIDGAATTASPSSIVFLVNSSLLTTYSIAQIQNAIDNIVIVVSALSWLSMHLYYLIASTSKLPNTGVLAPDVATEIQTIRRSPTTGRVTEALEMFGWTGSVLTPIVTKEGKIPRSDSNATGEGETAAKEDLKPLPPPPQQLNTRLITFDSTDPEFDEDSDPDADLDL